MDNTLPRHRYRLGNALFAQPFEPANPVTTPNGLARPQTALDKLVAAQLLLTNNNIALDVPLGQLQTGHRMHEKVAAAWRQSTRGHCEFTDEFGTENKYI